MGRKFLLFAKLIACQFLIIAITADRKNGTRIGAATRVPAMVIMSAAARNRKQAPPYCFVSLFLAGYSSGQGSSLIQEASLNQRSAIFFMSPEPLRVTKKFSSQLTRSGSPAFIATPMGSKVKGAFTVVSPLSL